MMSTPDQIAETHHDLLFGVRRSTRYHMRRRRFFELWHAITNFIGIATGSAAVAAVVGAYPGWAGSLGAMVAVASALDLVIGTAEMARKHSDLAARFVLLERELVLAGDPTEENVRMFTAKRLEIEAGEPPILRALDRLCYNELCRAMGEPASSFKHVPLYQKWLAQLISFELPYPK